MFSKTTIQLALATVAPLAIAACDNDGDDLMQPAEVVNLVETAEAAGTFNTLIAALDATGLRSTIESGGTFTVFAPTDAAFAMLPAGTLDALLADPDALSEILLYHVLDGNVPAADVATSALLPTLNGQAATIASTANGLSIDGANIVSTDIIATNGTIHVIDQVILPSTHDIVELAIENESFSILVSVLQTADLVGALQGDGPFTVFAPTDEAFAAVPTAVLDMLLTDVDLLTQVLTYHVVPGRVLSTDVVGLTSAETLNGASVSISVEGGAVLIDNATVTATDVQGTNGVIHVIDAVILPPAVLSAISN